MKHSLFLLFFLLLFSLASAQEKAVWRSIVGSAYLENQSYRVLQRLCDETGGRLVGSPNNEKGLQILIEELRKVGWEKPSLERFRMPGWVRGADEVKMLTPVQRELKAVALGYVNTTPTFQAPVIYAGLGRENDYDTLKVQGKIVLVTSERLPEGQPPLRLEAIRIAARHGARAILFINKKIGAINLAGTGNFQGEPTPIPAFSLTGEEGRWLRRLTEKSLPVKLEITTRSHCKDIETANVVLTLPGETNRKIVVGAHFDSWDLAQGAIDNGLGTAILFDVARLLKKFSPRNFYTVELVWFNGEELGLWGSKNYLRMHREDDIAAMVNMDMTGSPTGFNAMGFDELVPLLRRLADQLNGFDLRKGAISRPWTNSDHMPFMLQGIPVITLQAHLDEEMGRYYHSAGDSFDKVNKKYLSEAAAVVSIMVRELANRRDFHFPSKNENQVVEILKKFHLDDRLKRQGEWIFQSE